MQTYHTKVNIAGAYSSNQSVTRMQEKLASQSMSPSPLVKNRRLIEELKIEEDRTIRLPQVETPLSTKNGKTFTRQGDLEKNPFTELKSPKAGYMGGLKPPLPLNSSRKNAAFSQPMSPIARGSLKEATPVHGLLQYNPAQSFNFVHHSSFSTNEVLSLHQMTLAARPKP